MIQPLSWNVKAVFVLQKNRMLSGVFLRLRVYCIQKRSGMIVNVIISLLFLYTDDTSEMLSVPGFLHAEQPDHLIVGWYGFVLRPVVLYVRNGHR